MEKTTFKVSQMDCAAEENLIGIKLSEIPGIRHLDFDLPARRLTVFHEASAAEIERALQSLNLGAEQVQSEASEESQFEEIGAQRKLLWTILLINFVFFLVEMASGLLSKSMGLVADSLDMLADAFVYGISLLAVGSSLIRKKRIARLAGYFQISLALLGFLEILRRFFGSEKLPDFSSMIVVSVFALLANGYCLYLLQKSKSKKEVHLKASLIFTSNDLLINLGVIVAGVLVHWLQSSLPDLLVGSLVFVLVMRGAFRILKLGK